MTYRIMTATVALLVVSALPIFSATEEDGANSEPPDPLAAFTAFLDSHPHPPAVEAEFRCPDTDQPLTAEFYLQEPGGVVVRFAGEQRPAVRVRSASGSRYQGVDVEFWEHGDEAMLTWDDRQLNCLANRSD